VLLLLGILKSVGFNQKSCYDKFIKGMSEIGEKEYKDYSEDLLVKLLKSDNKEAFHEIYRRYWHPLFLVARRKLNSQENAEEIVQDIFTDLWIRRTGLQIDDLKRYLLKSVKYKVLNTIKARLVRHHYENQTILSASEANQCTEDELAYYDLHRAIEEALVMLPDKTEKIFRLNRLEQQSVSEISTLLNIPERTVEYHITQSLRVLRLHLRDFVLCGLFFFSK
jgi:RNA polymerase sigma-70 factor (family 1)